MSVGYVQSLSDSSDANGSFQVAITITGVTAGNALVLGAFWKNNVTIVSVTATGGGSMVDCGAGRLARPTDGFLQMLGLANAPAGSVTLTITFSGAPLAANNRFFVEEWSGVNAVAPFDSVSATGTATSGTHLVTGSLTPTIAVGAVLYWQVDDHSGNAAPDAGYTERMDSGAGRSAGDQIFNATPGALTAGVTTDGAVTKAGIIAAVLNGQTYKNIDMTYGWARF